MQTIRALFFIVGFCCLAAPAAHAQFPVDDRFTLRASQEVGVPGGSVEARVLYDGQDGSTGLPAVALRGWAYGLCHDDQLLSVVDVVDGTTTAALVPDFNSIQEQPNGGGGFTVGVALDTLGVVTLDPGIGLELNRVTYGVAPTLSWSTSLDFCDTLGWPQVDTVVVTQIGSLTLAPIQVSGSLTVLEEEFVRGECNNDGAFNLADVILFLSYLFPQSGVPALLPCADACDSNDDGSLNLADGMASLTALFGVPQVPLPGSGGCEPDSGPDGLDCGIYDGCP